VVVVVRMRVLELTPSLEELKRLGYRFWQQQRKLTAQDYHHQYELDGGSAQEVTDQEMTSIPLVLFQSEHLTWTLAAGGFVPESRFSHRLNHAPLLLKVQVWP
jgi:hypothetical protein